MRILILSGLFVLLAIFILIFSGCRDFDVVRIQGQPDECNDFYTVMKYYAAAGKGDSAFVGTVFQECKEARGQARKIIKGKYCKELIFGVDNLDKNDYKKYADFLECSK